ncbi:putative carbonic anhydrase 3 isoform X4 [Parasteatoda tepidariorum]|uniref:putative carbonic anhydrase 3 isoform X4 n=1 Tax=Parasteatoda tepidariorum TaxID=114398 RepID=UPI0039BC2318
MEIKFIFKWYFDYSCILECLTGSCVFKCEKVQNYISNDDKSMTREKENLQSYTWMYTEETPVEIKCSNKRSFAIKEGGLDDTFLFRQLHFHWGISDSDGSEHRINGIQFPLETHLVFESLKNTTNGGKTLAVLAIFFKISAEKNVILDPIFRTLTKIRNVEDEEPILSKLRLRDLLPRNTKKYFRYEGSLTTPPCTEGVVWTVFSETLSLSKEQMEKFRQLHLIGQTSHNLSFNHRPVQKLNNRIILESKSISN